MIISIDDTIFIHELSKQLIQYFEYEGQDGKKHKLIDKAKRRLSKEEWTKISEIVTKYNFPVAIYINGLFGGDISLKIFGVDYQNNELDLWLEVLYQNMPIIDDDYMLLSDTKKIESAYHEWLSLLNSEKNLELIKKYDLPETREFIWYVDWDV